MTTMKRSASFILTALVIALLPVTVQAQAPYPLRQYLSIRAAAGPTVSPDGKQVAFRTTLTGTSQLWKVKQGDSWPDQLTFFPSSIASAKWSPTGDWIEVSADRDGTEQFQMYLVKPDGSQIVSLTNNPKIRTEFGGWSNDGKQLYYASNARDDRYFDCYLMDVATKQERLVYKQDAILFTGALSHDGRWMAAGRSNSNVDTDLYLVDTTNGSGRHLTPHKGDVKYSPIGFSADDKTLYVASDLDKEFVNLAAIDLASGKLSFLKEEDHDVETATLSSDGRYLAYTVNRDGYQDLNVWDFTAKQPVSLPRMPNGIVTTGDFTNDGHTLSLVLNAPSRSADVWLLDLTVGHMQQVTRSSAAGIDARSFVEPSLVKYKSFDGREISAFLYLPKNAPKDHSLPTILSVHGGPEAQERPLFNPLYQYFVSRGYAVLAPNIRGSSGFGKSYLAMDNGPKRWDALKDLDATVDFIGMQPALNPGKVAIIGGSYGGFAVLAMMAHYPKRFAAGIDMFGVTDFKTFLANTAPFRRPLRAAEYGDPVKDSAYMDAISPALHADRITAPLMVIQGSNDPRVPESESAQIVKKVRAKGRPVEYLLFPDEGHGIAKLPNRIKAYEAAVAFLDKYLK
jgi:dipeptidyl aminopeptidase/acylaminoacyl peptidase